jgi:hypothetical protein
MKTFDLATLPEYPRTRQDRELVEMTYNNFFETALEIIASGRTLSSIIADDHRAIQYARFLKWVRKDPRRVARYTEAKEICAEIMVGEIVAISDGAGDSMLESPLDRDNTRIKTRQWLAGKYNKKLYGDSKTVEMNVTEMSDQDLEKLSTDEIKRMILEAQALEADFTVEQEDQGETAEPWML